MAMKPPDEGQPTDYPQGHDRQIALAGERSAEGQHDEADGQYTEHEERDLDVVQSPRR
jgi:hypothetical protein